MSDLAFNVWGTVAAIIGIIALIPTFFIWLRGRLPPALLPELDKTFVRTKASFEEAIQEGVFADKDELAQFNVTLGTIYTRVLDIRAQVTTRTFRQNAINWWQGLSGRIVALCEELTSLQAKLADRTSRERKRLASMGNVAGLPLLSDYKVLHDRPLGQHMTNFPRPFSGSGGSEKCEYPSPSIDGTTGGGLYRFVGQRSGQPTHHLISDSDFQSLLSVALSSSTGEDENAESQYAERPSDILLDFGNSFCDPPSSDNDLDPKRSRLFNLSRVVKRIYSVRFHGRGKDTDAHISIDPESLMPITVDISDCNDFKTSVDSNV
ncbi:hypothetical protein C8Q70DRAFT_265298 [Cubamyces menziesii]|nr:hypothetical protein C8Q70DRAFT_265298 [Cubamyces menziesii]